MTRRIVTTDSHIYFCQVRKPRIDILASMSLRVARVEGVMNDVIDMLENSSSRALELGADLTLTVAGRVDRLSGRAS